MNKNCPKYKLDNGRSIVIYDAIQINGVIYVLCYYEDDINKYYYYKKDNNTFLPIESVEELEFVAKSFADKIPTMNDTFKDEIYIMIESLI